MEDVARAGITPERHSDHHPLFKLSLGDYHAAAHLDTHTGALAYYATDLSGSTVVYLMQFNLYDSDSDSKTPGILGFDHLQVHCYLLSHRKRD